jgi:tRNA dimethylallyltransferase
MSKKIIVILGPTASGKSELAIKLAKKFRGEVISADSRQIYRGMDIGTGKVTKEKMKNIPHHLLDIASPKRRFTVAQYRKLAIISINKIFKKGKIPIICGGTGFYVQALIDGITMPEVKPDPLLRLNLNKLKTEELFKRLKKLDSRRAKTIDKNNRRRLIRALEIVIKTKKPVPSFKKSSIPYPVLMIGTRKKTEDKIVKRVNKIMRQGLEKEVKTLVKKCGWAQALQTIGYQEWKEYFEGKISRKQVRDLIILHTKQYAKRQLTWWKPDKRIRWVKNLKKAEKKIKIFLKN